MDINSLLSPGPQDSQESSPSRAASRSSSAFGPNSSPLRASRQSINPRKSALSHELHLDNRGIPIAPHLVAQDHHQLSLPSIASYNSSNNSPPPFTTSSPSSASSIAIAGPRHSPNESRGYLEKRPRLQTASAQQSHDSRTSSSSTSGMDALAEVASRQQPQSVASPTNPGRQRPHHRQQLQQRHDRSSSASSTSLPLGKSSTPRITAPLTSTSASTSVEALMPDAPPPPQHAHIASSLSAEESKRLAELAAAITAKPFDFSAHLDYVSLLHTGFARNVESGRKPVSEYELLGTLKLARNAMDKIFPVGETLWVEWLTDENLLARTIDDRLTLMELHHRSVLEEPSSAQLWLLYGDYMYYLWSSCSKDDESNSNSGEEDNDGSSFGWSAEDKRIGREVFEWDSMIDVWEQGVARTQWHLNDGNIVWDRYMEILLVDLSRHKTPEKTAKIRDKFVDRLTNRAHSTWDQTFSAYSTFVSTYYDSATYEEAMVNVTRRAARAKKVFDLREPYEFRVQQARERMDKQAEWAAYSEYLNWELRMKGVFSKDLINGLYERATTRFATDASLWSDYVVFLIESSPLTMQSPSGNNSAGNDEEGLPALDVVLERATRHCPWSGELWSHRLLTMEAEGRTFAEIEEVKHKATVSGLVDMRGLEDLMKVYIAWTGYLSRRAFVSGATEDDVDMAEVGILSSLEHVQKVLADTADDKKNQGDPQYRLERMYIKLLFKKNDQEGMRKLWNDLSSRPAIADRFDFWNRYYIWSLVIHERNRHTDVLDGNQDHKNDHINPNPNQPWREGTAVLERALARVETLDWPEQLIQQYINHCEQHETVLEYKKAMIAAKKASKLVTERREKESASWKAQQEQAQMQALPIQPEPGQTLESAKRKREEEPESRNKKAKQDGYEIADVNMTDIAEEPKRDREHTVILVKNLPESATELKVRQFFRDCGTIKSLNLVDDASNTKTATVEFETKEDALYAQTKAAKPFDGHAINVEFSSGSVLWVANYPPAADEKYIRSLFQPVSKPGRKESKLIDQHGEILEVRFPSVKLNTFRRFCYVQFSSPIDAQAAANALDGTVLDGKFHLQAKISDPSKKQERGGALHEGREVVVKNVDWSATEDEVRKIFEDVVGSNAIEKVHRLTTLDGRSKGIAFVSLSSKELAEEAIKKLDNTSFMNRTLKVELAVEKGKRIVGRIVRGETEEASERASTPAETNGEIRADSKSARSRTIALLGVPDTVNAARLERLIAPHGEIRKLTLRTDHAGAIVEFADEKSVGVAGLALDGAEIDGAKLRVGSVEELLKGKPVDKALNKKGLGFGAGVVSRPKGAGPKGRLVMKPTVAKADKMDVDVNGDKKLTKSNSDFREMFLKGKK